MKPKEFASVLRGFADILGEARANDAKGMIAAFASVFEADSATSVVKVIERLGKLPVSGALGGATLG
jgi:hypothetical protein